MGGGAAFGPVTWSHGTDDYVAGLAWGGDDRLAAATLGGTVTVLDGADGSVVTKLPDHPLGALAVAWSPDGRLLASGGHDGIARIVDGATGATRGELSGRGWVGAVAWRPDGGLLAAAIGRTVSLLDPDGTVVLTSEPVASTITSVVWSADGRRVGVGCYGGVSWYEVERGSSPVKHFAWKGSVLSLAVSPDGRWLTGGAQDQTVHIWRLWSADDLEMSGYPTKVEHLSWHHSSKRMAVGNLGEITIWDFSGRGPGGRRPRQLEGHERHISALAFQPGGDLLASGGADGRLLLWDGTSRSSSPLDRLDDVGGPIARLAWSADDRHLAVARSDGLVSCHEVG